MNQFSGVSSAVHHLRATTNKWHHPHISRAEGAQLLENCEAGSFILRESSKGGSFALSVVLPNSSALGHYLVEKRGPECFCLQGSENAFCTIEELLAHYHHHDSIGLPCRLRLPQRHSSSMSYSTRPSLPPLPPRNNSRAGSISRPMRYQPPIPQPHSPKPSQLANPNPSILGGSPGFGGPAKPHPVQVQGPPGIHVPQTHTVKSPGPTRKVEPEEGETYEDMASGRFSPQVATMHIHAPHSPTLSPSKMEDGETYEDMAAGAISKSGFGAGGIPHPVTAVKVHPPTSPMEEGETYEDMAAGGLSTAGFGSASGMSTPADMDEFGETYEDMAGGLKQEIVEEPQDTYEDMSVVSPVLRK